MSIQPSSVENKCRSSSSPRSSAPVLSIHNRSADLYHRSDQNIQGPLPPAYTDSNPIASPPVIRKERSLSTAVTTVMSNKRNSSTIRKFSLEWHAIDVDHRQSGVDYCEDFGQWNDDPDHPPISEIRIPKGPDKKRRCLHCSRVDEDCLSTTSSQDLSNGGDEDFDCHNDMSDYKTMFFKSERENHALRGQVLGMQESNRKLKRQLIEMQKQIFAYSRNKRQAVFSHLSSQSQSPWSIPVEPYRQRQRKAPVVRIIKEATDILPSRQQNHSSITPTSLVSKERTSGASKSVSMSVSSEEGNLSRS